jgi:hypothetical protein
MLYLHDQAVSLIAHDGDTAADPHVVPALVELAQAHDAALERGDVEHLREGAMISPFDGKHDGASSADVNDRFVHEPNFAGNGAIQISERVDSASHVVRGACVQEPHLAALLAGVRGCYDYPLFVEEDVASYAGQRVVDRGGGYRRRVLEHLLDAGHHHGWALVLLSLG